MTCYELISSGQSLTIGLTYSLVPTLSFADRMNSSLPVYTLVQVASRHEDYQEKSSKLHPQFSNYF